MTRLLFVDGSDLMGWLVARLIPRNVEIVRVGSFAEADRFLREQPPDAAIFNLTPRHLDWRTLIDRCVYHEPVIPFLCCTAIENDEEIDGPLPCRPEDYFTKSIPLEDLRRLLNRLVEEARTNRCDRFSREKARCGVPADRKPA
jgi:DNA-binding NtrC family response regulator